MRRPPSPPAPGRTGSRSPAASARSRWARSRSIPTAPTRSSSAWAIPSTWSRPASTPRSTAARHGRARSTSLAPWEPRPRCATSSSILRAPARWWSQPTQDSSGRSRAAPGRTRIWAPPPRAAAGASPGSAQRRQRCPCGSRPVATRSFSAATTASRGLRRTTTSRRRAWGASRSPPHSATGQLLPLRTSISPLRTRAAAISSTCSSPPTAASPGPLWE